MKEFIENLIGRLEEEKAKGIYDIDNVITVKDAYGKAIKIVNQLAEEYKLSEMPTGWIACSDRFPKVSGEYYTYVYYDGHYMYSVNEIDCDGIIKEWNCSPDYQIIAWKPIEFYQPIGE